LDMEREKDRCGVAERREKDIGKFDLVPKLDTKGLL
jgi:hypothetical protein